MRQNRQQLSICNFKMSRIDINYVGQLFKFNGKPKLWEEFKKEFNLQGQFTVYLYPDNTFISKCWKDALTANSENI